MQHALAARRAAIKQDVPNGSYRRPLQYHACVPSYVPACRDFLLRLPHNKAAFGELVAVGLHPAYQNLQGRLPLAGSLGRALAQRLEATLSQLAHWCPVFGEPWRHAPLHACSWHVWSCMRYAMYSMQLAARGAEGAYNTPRLPHIPAQMPTRLPGATLACPRTVQGLMAVRACMLCAQRLPAAVVVRAAEASFLPGLVFPFVKMYAAAAGPGAALDESCFELLATLLTSWCRGWFERFPHPPLGVLNRLQVREEGRVRSSALLVIACAMQASCVPCVCTNNSSSSTPVRQLPYTVLLLRCTQPHRCLLSTRAARVPFVPPMHCWPPQDLLQFHDAPLAAHFSSCYRGGLPGVVWPHMATLMTELLPRHEWIKVRLQACVMRPRAHVHGA